MTTTDFDARAATWDDDPQKLERAQAVADAIVRHVALTPAMRALEYGCGTGVLSFLLRSRLGPITLADVSDGMLAVAAGKIATAHDPAMRAVKLDLIADPPPAERFDVVYSLMTLHHIPDTGAISNASTRYWRGRGFCASRIWTPRTVPFTAPDSTDTLASIACSSARKRDRRDSRAWNSRRPTR